MEEEEEEEEGEEEYVVLSRAQHPSTVDDSDADAAGGPLPLTQHRFSLTPLPTLACRSFSN